MPATLTLTKKGVAAAGEDAAAALETAAGGACRWRLRQGGPVVICPSAADVVRRISGGDETRRWSVVQQIEGSVMELRATVLVAGSLHVGLHRNISGLVSPWTLRRLLAYAVRLRMCSASPSMQRPKIASAFCRFPTVLRYSRLRCLRFAIVDIGKPGYLDSRIRSQKTAAALMTASQRMLCPPRLHSFRSGLGAQVRI